MNSTPWVVCPHPHLQAELVLYCFPFAGGSAAAYHRWHAGLPSSIEVRAIQLPGRQQRIHEKPFTELDPLIQEVAAELAQQIDRPYAMFGHSLGAILSFECVRRLRKLGKPAPAILFASGTSAPISSGDISVTPELSDAMLIQELQNLKGIPPALLADSDYLNMILPTIRADFILRRTYVYQPEQPLNCRIVAFGGLQDAVPYENLEAWRQHTSRSFVLHMLPGDHFFIRGSKSELLRLIGYELSLAIKHSKK